ncbi:hypothetical protein GMMP1_1560002 [Candidatus Magnetomoraceae bacterium gMMP-1]
MNEQTFWQLISKGESESLEFKMSFNKEAIETLTAFANTKGGNVIIGINDNGELQGIQVGKESLQNWLNQIKLNTSPSIIPDIEEIKINSKTLVILRINEYPVKPISCKGEYFKRVQNSNHQMDIVEISNLHLQTLRLSWDNYKDVSHSLNDISLEKVGFIFPSYLFHHISVFLNKHSGIFLIINMIHFHIHLV